MKDGIPDNKAGEWPTNRTNLETIAGNHLVIDVGRGRWMLYAHLQPGSVRVKPGDRVAAGQVLGRLGNSGNTPEPHLHLQLLDRNSALGGQGLPYDMPRFKLLGKAVLAFGGAKVSGGPSAAWLAQPEERRNEIPLENAIVEFVK
jgi:murein DD-endopeptidase MepM/ murein hydrolase activator NlpD